jgi:soluble lytic murein transglycosylase-like protein
VEWLGRDVVGSTPDPTVPEENVALTAAYFAHLLDRSEGDVAASLAAYHRGLRQPADGIWDLDTVAFVRAVLESAPGFAGRSPDFAGSEGQDRPMVSAGARD